eukprot:3941722-Rhodomonas_salina.2
MTWYALLPAYARTSCESRYCYARSKRILASGPLELALYQVRALLRVSFCRCGTRMVGLTRVLAQGYTVVLIKYWNRAMAVLVLAEKQAVPGQGSLNFTFALLDSGSSLRLCYAMSDTIIGSDYQ